MRQNLQRMSDQEKDHLNLVRMNDQKVRRTLLEEKRSHGAQASDRASTRNLPIAMPPLNFFPFDRRLGLRLAAHGKVWLGPLPQVAGAFLRGKTCYVKESARGRWRPILFLCWLTNEISDVLRLS